MFLYRPTDAEEVFSEEKSLVEEEGKRRANQQCTTQQERDSVVSSE